MPHDEGKWQKSDNFSLVFIGGSLALWLLFHTIWSILFEDWVKHQLERVVGHKVADMIEKSGSAGFPLLAAIGVTWFLLAYAKRHYQGNTVDAAIEAQRQHTEALREQTAALREPPREPFSLPKSQASSLPTWLELEQRFKELEAGLQFCRINHQTGDAGEYWRFGGNASREAQERFHAVAALASARLFYDFDVDEFQDLAEEIDPKRRWYKALRHLGEGYEMSPHFAWQEKEDGSRGYIYTGFIDKPAAASATLCLSLASRGL